MSSASRLRREQAKRTMAASTTSRSPTGASPAPTAATAGPRQAPVRPEPTLRQRARYRFDNSMSGGVSALIWYLAGAVAIVVIIFAVIILILGAGPTHDPITAIYNVLLHTIDTGTQANDTGTTYEIPDLLVTFAGIFIFSAFIGVLSNSIDDRLQDLRKGRSAVIEYEHTLILGWSDAVFAIISELVVANESRKRASIVILANEDKVMMEDAIRARVGDTQNTRVICRSGDPMSGDLTLASPVTARSVIVLAPEGDHPDAQVIKTILSLTRDGDEFAGSRHIVAEISDAQNLGAARLAGGSQTVVLDKSLTVSRLIVQTSRQSGVAFVYQDLLDFDGDEMYLRNEPRFDGQTFGDILLGYEDCSIIGLHTVDGGTVLNPPMDTIVAPGTDVIAVAEDDSVLEAAQAVTAVVDEAAIQLTPLPEGVPELTHVYGYNQRTPAVVSELDEYAEPGSRVQVVAIDPPEESEFLEHVGPLQNLTVTLRRADTADRGVLDKLDVPEADRVVVMCDSEHLERGQADARVLVTLLHLRDIAGKSEAEFTIVSEILEETDRELALVANVDDIILSEQVSSYLLAQISEDRRLAEIFDELFQSEGSEVYLRPVEAYVRTGAPVNFATLIVAARGRGETAFGYRVAADSSDADAAYGIHMNPAKSEAFTIAPGDQLIVLAED
jgi:voltage-gated potassium channel Kch